MEKGIGIIGHIDHSKTTLMSENVSVIEKSNKTIHEIIEEGRSFKFTAPIDTPLVEWNFKTGKESRRERRAKERKANKKHK